MRRSNISLAILIAALAIPIMPSAAQQQSTPSGTQQALITIVNNTGFPIWYVLRINAGDRIVFTFDDIDWLRGVW